MYAFFFPKTARFFFFLNYPERSSQNFPHPSLVPSWIPSCTKPLCASSTQLQLWKLISLQHHWAHTCTPCRYHLWGMGKPVLHCQNTVMVCFQSRACGCKQAKPVWVRCTELGGKEDRHKDPQSCFVEFKSVSELQLLNLQSDRQPLACGIQLLLWDTECGDTEVWDPARNGCEVQENFLTSL